MSSATFYTGSDSDDGYWKSTGILSSTGFLILGYDPPARDCFIGFSSVSIDRNSTIDSVYLNLTGQQGQSGANQTVRIYAVASDNAVAPTSVSEADALSLTSSYVDWSIPSVSTGVSYSSPDISSVVDEVTSRSGWVSGSKILVVLKNISSSVGSCYFYSYGQTVPPSLESTWSAPVSNDIVADFPALSMDVFPLAMSGAIADMSIPALQSLQLGGEVLLPVMNMAAIGYEYVAGAGAIGSMSLRINNNGLGGISCSSTSAPLGDTTIPSATMSATAKPGNDGVMTFQVATMTGLEGARGEATLPLATVASWTTNPGNGVVAMTQMSMSASVTYANIVGQGVMTMRGVDASAIGLVGRGGSATVGVKMSMNAHGISGQLASASPRMIPPTANGFASINLVGVMDTEMFQVESAAIATANSSEFTGPVVYEKGAVR